ncbi:Hint domain-containing protein [Marivita sp. GX14005]|uniref:Hint domain-containing protein n=1 Tax=Marivita sp. GX14005 TaxID=2942276 RepID=UPI0020196B4C|nr:Hint domain-containing protein [Marivita sp. GX14005]MCL3881790.1 Hint domain-containing protein [Marivita sp. GX14005]
MATAAELTYITNASAMDMANAIFGNGVSVVNASYTGDNRSSAIYEDGDALSPGVTPGDTGVILSTGRADAFTRSPGPWWWGGNDPNISQQTGTNTSGQNNNSDFNAAAGTNTYDASYLDVDFIPDEDTMTMRFVFSSEEYPEFTDDVYQDFVGVWVNGTQVNILPGNGDVDPANLNEDDNSNLFISNANDDYNTEMDGFTVTLTMKMNVIPGQVNSIRIGIADVVDSNYDSNLLIAADSIQTDLIAEADSLNIYTNSTKTIDVLSNDINNTGSALFITHINGIAVTPGDSVTLNTGQVVTLTPAGTLSVTSDSDFETVNFTYEVESASGEIDTGFVTIATVPCFVAGTMIRTDAGQKRVERLEPGDLVWTMDNGFQPLRWIGQRTVAATGTFAPVRVAAGTFGEHANLMLSPQHRILMRDPLADLVFGTPEVLVAAKHLIDGRNVQSVEGGSVTYVHLLFDRHEIIMANGLATESFLPGPQTMDAFEEDIITELVQLFPELDPETGEGYGDAARQILKRHEAAMFIGAAA